MTMIAAEAASIAEGSAAQSAATTIGKSQAKKAAVKKSATGAASRGAAKPRMSGAGQRVSRAGSSSTSRTPTRSRSISTGKSHYRSYQGSSGSSHKSLKLNLKGPTLSGGKTSSLIIEWAIGAAIIFWALFDGTKKSSSFQSQAHSFFWRFFAWSFTFFVLALLMRGKSTAKFAVLFGLLLDITLLVMAAMNGSFGALANLFSRAPFTSIGGGAPPGGGNSNQKSAGSNAGPSLANPASGAKGPEPLTPSGAIAGIGNFFKNSGEGAVQSTEGLGSSIAGLATGNLGAARRGFDRTIGGIERFFGF